MADITSSLPVTDTTDGTLGASAPTAAQQIAGRDVSGNLQAIKLDAQNGVLVAGEGTAGSNVGGVFSVQGIANGTPLLISSRREITNYAILGNAFCISNAALTVASASTNLIYISNPNGSGKTLYMAAALLVTAPASPNWVSFNLSINPTVTVNGTSQAILNLLAGSANTSVVSAFTGPTTSSLGSLIDVSQFGGQNSAPSVQAVTYDLIPYIVIPPNNKFLLSGSAKANNTPVEIILKWFEV